jgi:hypothetical protein
MDIAARHSRTHVAGAVLLAVGSAGVIASLALQGPSSAWLARSWTLGLLALLGFWALTMPAEGSQRMDRAVMVAMWLTAALVLANAVVAWVDLDAWVWRAPMYFPPINPIGADFRNGAYEGARTFSTGTNGWPPLTLVLYQPYRLFDQNTAYVIHVLVMIALDLAAIVLAVAVARTPAVTGEGVRDDDQYRSVGRLGPVVAGWLFVSVGFLLSVERGSIDALVGFLAMAGLFSLVRRPHDVWTPTILFALAANLKIYPAILLVLVIWRFRWKSVLPIVVSIVVLALIAGPANLQTFVTYLRTVVAGGAGSWVGNSSAQSFAWFVDTLRPWYLPHLPGSVLLAVPVTLFLLTAGPLWRRRDGAATALMACATFPPMCLVPTISHDYKTVILAGPILLLLAILLGSMRLRSAEPWWMLLALTATLFFVARAPGQMVEYGPPAQAFVWPLLLMNKYLPILALQFVIVWMAWRLPRLQRAAADPA